MVPGLGGRGSLLTGASRGPGLATARALVDDGARVLLGSRPAVAVEGSGRVVASALSPAASDRTGTMTPVDGGVPRPL